jgi:multiple sugar transport system permease protein
MNIKHTLSRIPAYMVLAVTATITLYPFLFMFSTSLKDTLSIYSTATQLIPTNPTLDNYVYILKEIPFLRWV